MVDVEILKALKNYLLTVCPALLQGNPDVFREAVSEDDTEDILRMFAGDADKSILVVQKRVPEQIQRGGSTESIEPVSPELKKEFYLFQVDMKTGSHLAAGKKETIVSLAFIKSLSQLDSSPMASQLHVCQLRDDSPFQTILRYVRHCFLPYSRSLLETEGDVSEDLAIVRGVNGKLRELEIELLRSQQAIDIPQIGRAVQQECRDRSRMPSSA
eukprot:TRINITY_DN21814_c0_g1_i1.p1 TRINITY_DN21814_c0_g1~~TRINITY_DN21814_c0_g1_i1.p1  ORF type:complete len:247 (-),score=40.46 TRINITY_DN21814_c0_g1_i1:19-660(-)